jgi:hypothetical protein
MSFRDKDEYRVGPGVLDILESPKGNVVLMPSCSICAIADFLL